MPSALTFQLFPLRFTFVARDAIQFPDLLPANLLRGAFGLALRRVDPPTYNAVFAPRATAPGPSGLVNRPRPFVFRAPHLARATITAGCRFFFDIHLFDTRHPALIATLCTAFYEMGARGLGPQRSAADLQAVTVSDIPIGFERKFRARSEIGFEPKFRADAEIGFEPPSRANAASTASEIGFEPQFAVSERNLSPLCLSLTAAGAEETAKVSVRFVTPTELKSAGSLAAQPTFEVLACRARDRISALQSFYGPGPLPLDFREFARRAAAVRLTRCAIEHVPAERRSSRTGQTHPLGGFIGLAEYEGVLAEFLPFLRAAQWTGVGRQTVWGKGEIAVSL